MMQVRFAAVEVVAMTGTASPSWKPRAEARKASAAATAATGSQGESASASRPSPAAPVSAFSATSPTPNSTPAAAPRSAPWWWAGAPIRGAVISSRPTASATASKTIRPGTANAAWWPSGVGIVRTSSTSPPAVIATPAHWRRPTLWPNTRSPSTARITTPVESTTCTVESGASASAKTCRTQAPTAIAMPIANHFEASSARALASGRRSWTSGAQPAPRCLHRKPSCVTTAHTSASAIPSSKPDPLLEPTVPRTRTRKRLSAAARGHRPRGQRRAPSLAVRTNARRRARRSRRRTSLDRAPLELHRRRQLVAARRPLLVEDPEALDLLDGRQRRVGRLDRLPIAASGSSGAPASGSSTISATLYGRRSPITTAEPISGLAAFSRLSMLAGDMFLPPAEMISSFLRSTIDR